MFVEHPKIESISKWLNQGEMEENDLILGKKLKSFCARLSWSDVDQIEITMAI